MRRRGVVTLQGHRGVVTTNENRRGRRTITIILVYFRVVYMTGVATRQRPIRVTTGVVLGHNTGRFLYVVGVFKTCGTRGDICGGQQVIPYGPMTAQFRRGLVHTIIDKQ